MELGKREQKRARQMEAKISYKKNNLCAADGSAERLKTA